MINWATMKGQTPTITLSMLTLVTPQTTLSVVPTGGVTPETIGEFLKAGAIAGAAGSALVDGKSLKEKNWAAITAKAQAFVKAVAAAGGAGGK